MPPPAWLLVPPQSTPKSPSTLPVSTILLALCFSLKEPSARAPMQGSLISSLRVPAELADVTRQSSSWLRLAARHAFLWLRRWKPEQKQATLAAPARGQPHAASPRPGGHHHRERTARAAAGHASRPTCEQLQDAPACEQQLVTLAGRLRA
jgi:hypothetical protein